MTALNTKTNVLLDTFSAQYLTICLSVLDASEIGNLLKGKFNSLTYTTDGYDISNLSFEEKLNLSNLLFQLDVKTNSFETAKNRFETLVNSTKDRLGAESTFSELVNLLPEGTFEEQKLSALSKEELVQQLKKLKINNQTADRNTPVATQANAAVNSDTFIQSLQEKNKVLESILYNTGDGVCTLDSKGNILTFNRTMETLTGYSFAEVTGKHADAVLFLMDDYAPITTTRYNPHLDDSSGQKVYSNNKVTLQAQDGTKKNVKIMSSTLPNATNGSVGCIITLADISKEAQLETMKLDFVSIAAHELRTPLTSLRGYLTILSTGLANKIDPTHESYLKKVVVASDQLYILIENLLNISRIERGNLILQKNTEDWVQIVKTVIENFSRAAAEAKVTINLVIPPTTIPKVSVDKVMITEVLSNLLDNAIKYNKLDGRVTVILEPLNGEMITHIKDTGSGIPEESTPHLFKKFYRTSSSVWKQGKKGTGLGLFISHEIVKLHGGNIWFASKVDQGSTFSFTIPAVLTN